MADSYERALWAVEDARRERQDAELSGDHEAVLIWERTITELEKEASDALFFGGWDAVEERM